MAVDLSIITRDEVANIVKEARDTGRDKKVHLQAELERRYPGVSNATIRVGGIVCNALDYLVEDVESYGPKSAS